MPLPASPPPLLLLLLLLLHLLGSGLGSQEFLAGNTCLYVTRQSSNQVLLFTDFSKDIHGDHFDPIDAIQIPSPNPTGLTSHRNLLYVASYGPPPSRSSPKASSTIQAFDISSHRFRLVADFGSLPEVARCFPEALLFYQGFLYASCGVPKMGVLKIDPERRIVRAVLAKDVPLVWGLAARENYLYLSSHCHGHGEGSSAPDASVKDYCSPSEHDKIFRLDLNDEKGQAVPFASAPPSEDGETQGLADIVFVGDALLAVAFHSQSILKFSALDGSFQSALKAEALEFPLGITARDGSVFYTNPGRGELLQYDLEQDRQDLYAHPGPLLNSKLSFLTWARCPRPKHEEL